MIEEKRLKNRYQNQSWYIKCYRQFRYTPIAFLKSIWFYITVSKKSIIENEMSRFFHAKLIFRSSCIGLQHWYTSEEVFGKIKTKSLNSCKF